MKTAPIAAETARPDRRPSFHSDSSESIVLAGVGKQYGPVTALSSVDLAFESGRIHALVGQNGAGKSTALGILSGRIASTTGSVTAFGVQLGDGDPRASRAAGILTIYQELTILPALDAVANVFLAEPLSTKGFLSTREMRQRYERLCKDLGVSPVPDGRRARDLSVSDQQMLEILRAVSADAKAILFDEPTASLSEAEREIFHRIIRDLRRRGILIVLVSHNLDEIMDLADDISVFREGHLADSRVRAEWTKAQLIESMVGAEGMKRSGLGELLQGGSADVVRHHAATDVSMPPAARIRGLTVPGALEDVDLDIRAGEIIGIAGLVGSGRSTLLRALAGAEPTASGTVELSGGNPEPIPRSVRAGRRHRVALVPEERKTQGLFPSMSALDNVVVSDFKSVSRWGFISRRRSRKAAESASGQFAFARGRLDDAARNLSGGNQQKLLLARWTHWRPNILLVDEPTRGIDIGAKTETLEALRRMASEGLAVVVVSSELEEILAVSDRIEVLAHGRSVASFDCRTEHVDLEILIQSAFHREGATP